MDFSQALIELKLGRQVRRAGWNGKGMFLYLVQGSTFEVNRPPLSDMFPAGTSMNYRPHIDMSTVDGSCVPWVASQTDILENDWESAEEIAEKPPAQTCGVQGFEAFGGMGGR